MLKHRKSGQAFDQMLWTVFIFILTFIVVLILLQTCTLSVRSQEKRNEIALHKAAIAEKTSEFLDLPTIILLQDSYIKKDYTKFDSRVKSFFSDTSGPWTFEVFEKDEKENWKVVYTSGYGASADFFAIADARVEFIGIPVIDSSVKELKIVFEVQE